MRRHPDCLEQLVEAESVFQRAGYKIIHRHISRSARAAHNSFGAERRQC